LEAELLIKIKAEYEDGASVRDLVAKYSISSFGKLHYALKKSGVVMRQGVPQEKRGRNRKEYQRHELTPEFCWFLGWMWSDGNIGEHTAKIGLQRADKKVLVKIQEIVGAGSIIDSVSKIENKEYETTVWSLSRINFVNYLRELGLTEAKSLTCLPPKFIETKEQLAGFLLGYFEGDGHIRSFQKRGKEANKPEMIVRFYAGSKEMLDWVKRETAKLNIRSGKVLTYQRKDYNLEYNLIFNCRQAAKLCELMYEPGIIGLDRKHQVYRDWVQLPFRSEQEYKAMIWAE